MRPPLLRCEIEIRLFLEAADLAEFLTPEELAKPRDGERGKLGLARPRTHKWAHQDARAEWRRMVESSHRGGYEMPMAAYSQVDDVSASPQYGNTGPNGWGFTLWSDLFDDEAPHRGLLERFAAEWPQAGIQLPEYDRYEDFVECDAIWNDAPVWVYYETILSYLWFWSPHRGAVESLRAALLPLVR